jgi:S1-C subfamily serine protease
MSESRSPWPIALFSALLGGAVAVLLALLLGLGGDDTTTTVVQQAPLANTREAADGHDALTARDIYVRDAPGVVFVSATVGGAGNSALGQQGGGSATGSGFVIDKQGTILTNAHVVDNATKVNVQFQDDKVVEAKILGRDRSTDLAVLKVDPRKLDLKPLSLGSAKDVAVGDPVVAIGNPFGLDRTLTTGVVSAKQRQIQGLVSGFRISDVIQTDAAINPGNSGGPLIDASGRVIGINTQIATDGNTPGNVGIGFAVPIDTARKLLPDLKKGSVETGYLGITTRPVDESLKGLNLPVKRGALVVSVAPNSPAGKAGIRAGEIPAQIAGEAISLGGDIIVAVDGVDVADSEELSAKIGDKRKGDVVKITFLRDGKKRTVEVKLAARPQTDAGVPETPTQTQP